MKRPVTLTVAAVLVLLMILVSAVLPIATGNRMTAMGGGRFGSGGFGNGAPRGNFPNAGTPGARPTFVPQGNQGQSGSSTDTGNGNTQFQNRRGGNRAPGGLFMMSRVLQYVLYAVELILGVLSIIGLWLSKRWGSILAIITSALVLLVTLPSMFRFFAALTLIEAVVKVILAVAVIVLVALPKSKPVATVAA